MSIEQIVGLYVVVAGIWIVGSDLVLDTARGGLSSDAGWNMAKGLVFVIVTATLLYALLRRRQVTVDRARDHARQLELRLEAVQRMDAVGRLAGHVAHDFNNLLAVVRGHVDLLRPGVAPAGHDSLDAIDEAVRRSAALTGELQSVARRHDVELVPTDLTGLVHDCRNDLTGILPTTVQLHLCVGTGPLVVRLDPDHFPQVLMNLAANARDAMPDGGAFRIDLRRDAANAVLTASDTGRGMSPDELRHCFEPFFSTKASGKGTGLGLAITYGLVRQSGGEITASSEPGGGAAFEIVLPLVA